MNVLLKMLKLEYKSLKKYIFIIVSVIFFNTVIILKRDSNYCMNNILKNDF